LNGAMVSFPAMICAAAAARNLGSAPQALDARDGASPPVDVAASPGTLPHTVSKTAAKQAVTAAGSFSDRSIAAIMLEITAHPKESILKTAKVFTCEIVGRQKSLA
jgi:hypothetical protein